MPLSVERTFTPRRAGRDVIAERARRIQPLDELFTLRAYRDHPFDPFDDTRDSTVTGEPLCGLRHVACALMALTGKDQQLCGWIARTQREVLAQIPDELADEVVAFNLDERFTGDYGPELAGDQRAVLVNLYTLDGPDQPLAVPEPLRIPELSEQRIRQLSENVRFVIAQGDSLHETEPVDPISQSCTWDPKVTGPAEHLQILTVLRTYHDYGHPSLFKPSVGEVICQIPDELLGRVRAVSIDTDSCELVDGGRLHRAVTTLYEHAPAPRPITDPTRDAVRRRVTGRAGLTCA